jgi:hypothetical protein
VDTAALGRSNAEAARSVALMRDAMVSVGARQEEGGHRESKRQETRGQGIQCNLQTRLVWDLEGKGRVLGEQRVYMRHAFGLVS